MTYKDWKRRTERLKGVSYERVKTAARPFLESPSRQNARQLQECLTAWIEMNWHIWENAALDSGQAMRALYADTVEYLFQNAAVRLGNQAIEMEVRFGAYIDPGYLATLRSVFISPNGCAVKNFRSHERDDAFQNQFRTLMPALAGVASWVNGFTYPLQRRSSDFPALYGQQVPGNRVIELKPGFDNGTAFHELLHWVTHQDFENEAAQYPAEQFRIIEGVTEYFTRQVRPEHRSYENELGSISEAVEPAGGRRPILSRDQLAAAYFAGRNATAVVSALATLALMANEKATSDARRAAGKGIADQIQAVGRWQKKLSQPQKEWDDDLLAYLEATPLDTLSAQYGWDAAFQQRLVAKLRTFGITVR